MHFQKKTLASYIAALISGNLIVSPMAYGDESMTVQGAETVEVVGKKVSTLTETTEAYAIPEMSTATKFSLSPKDTPQSVTVMTRERMEDFGLTSLNDVLENTTGIRVEQLETNRAYYNARGFDIKNIQLDGVGLQNSQASSINKGDLDTVIYDHVEVVRGANGLATGAGSPSATINLVRKRPTDEFQASVSATGGSWHKKRLETDVSGALSDAGNVRGRLVTAVEETDSYLDRYNVEKNIVYGVLDANITDDTVITIGASQQKSQTDSPMFGSLPLHNPDGSETNYDKSTSSGADWTFNDEETRQLFIELNHQLNDDWSVTVAGLHTKQKIDSNVFFVSPNVFQAYAGLLPAPFSSLLTADTIGVGYDFGEETEQNNIDVYADGSFNAFGREHLVYLGASYSKSIHGSEGTQSVDTAKFTAPGYNPFADPDFLTDLLNIAYIDELDRWDGRGTDHIDLSAAEWGGASYKDRQISTYGAVRASLTDQLNLITGARITDWTTRGTSFNGTANDATESGVVTPYVGLIFDLTSNISTYASFTEIFTPQIQVDSSGNLLDSAEGQSYEFGVKSSHMNDRVQLSFAYFQIEQDNVAVEDVIVGGTQTYKSADGLSSKGFEVEVVGEFIDNLHTSLGYTYQDMDASDASGDRVTNYTPQQLVRFATAYRIPGLEALKVGSSINWQDGTENSSSAGRTKQDSYALIDLMASYDVNEHLVVQANAKNITDEDYYASLRSSGYSYKGAPANYELTARYNF